MDIFLSINKRESVIKLPVIPSDFKIASPQNNNKLETISYGELNLIGLRGLKSLTISSFFPKKDYPFLKDRTYKGWEYVNIIESWKERRVPVRLIITDTPINIDMTIEDFEYGPQDGSGDVYYDLSLTEFRYLSSLEKV
ncbi:hypothetical protein [Metabacillus litoralis]|uniref:hypothetical protein n=1 Tax=Metabacillus litoralis TaxID=152268 RepID=UPI00203C4BE6|nr:hypothetical protein [Metabacillus litoralis]MCM3411459.1 hypothetical protein [Metabacillus litoralis]